jgi:hypothetical protein
MIMPRFVLLYHDCPTGHVKPSHWDFMLEFDGKLRTWELRRLPAEWGGEGEDGNILPAMRLADHRIEYLNYEGPLTGNRGSVSRVATGEFQVIENTPERLTVRLDSEIYRDGAQLTATSQLGHWELKLLS